MPPGFTFRKGSLEMRSRGEKSPAASSSLGTEKPASKAKYLSESSTCGSFFSEQANNAQKKLNASKPCESYMQKRPAACWRPRGLQCSSGGPWCPPGGRQSRRCGRGPCQACTMPDSRVTLVAMEEQQTWLLPVLVVANHQRECPSCCSKLQQAAGLLDGASVGGMHGILDRDVDGRIVLMQPLRNPVGQLDLGRLLICWMQGGSVEVNHSVWPNAPDKEGQGLGLDEVLDAVELGLVARLPVPVLLHRCMARQKSNIIFQQCSATWVHFVSADTQHRPPASRGEPWAACPAQSRAKPPRWGACRTQTCRSPS